MHLVNRRAVAQAIVHCTACDLSGSGNGPVSFRGLKSSVMVLGEVPGREEDKQGRPFVGPAAQLLWKYLSKAGLKESEVFVANAVCCWPQATLEERHVKACKPHLLEQLYYCQPSWVLALGNTANSALGNKTPIMQLRGRPYEIASNQIGMVNVFPTLHPAAVLRNRTLLRGWSEDLQDFVLKVK